MRKAQVTVIKKYPNRRLYDTSTSTYITLDDVKQMVIRSEAMQVVDAKTNEDLTRATLMQILLEEEASGSAVFNVSMLSALIKLYGQAQQSVLAPFLENSLIQFQKAQQLMEEQMQSMPKGFDPHSIFNPANAFQKSMEENSKIWQALMQQQQVATKTMIEQMQTVMNPKKK